MKKILILSGILTILIGGLLVYLFIFGQASRYTNIENELKNYGYKVQEVLPSLSEKGPNDNFVNYKIYSINGYQKVSLSEYSSYFSAKGDLQSLSGPGAEWVALPHFFWRSKFIIIYLGNDKNLINDLEKILGKEYIPSSHNF